MSSSSVAASGRHSDSLCTCNTPSLVFTTTQWTPSREQWEVRREREGERERERERERELFFLVKTEENVLVYIEFIAVIKWRRVQRPDLSKIFCLFNLATSVSEIKAINSGHAVS